MFPDKARELFSVLKVSPHWRWTAGMQTEDGARLVQQAPDREGYPCYFCARGGAPSARTSYPYHVQLVAAIPDFSDPATIGCLLALARRAWGCDPMTRLHIAPTGEGWAPRVERLHRTRSGAVAGWVAVASADRLFGAQSYPTEVEAIVAAILAAPPETE